MATRTRVVLTPARAAHARKSVADLARSLAVIFGFLAVVLLVSPARELVLHGYGQAITTVDYTPEVAAARYFSHDTFLAPVGLPRGWRPTSARDHEGSGPGDPTTLHIGFVTPTTHYAAVEEAAGGGTAFEVSELGRKGAARVLRTLTIHGVAWQLHHDATGAPALTRQDGPLTVVVLGGANGGAGLGELSTLAGSLRG